MTELRKKVLAEIDALYEKDIDENLEKNLKLLYDYINDKNNLKDDRDIRIFLYTNRYHPAVKPFSKIDDTEDKAINQIITGKEPALIKEDIKLKDIFGETYAEPGVLDERKGDELKKLTDAKNVNLYDALKAKEDEDVRKAREEAFHGTNWLQQLFIPRTYERRMRGETDNDILDVNAKDLGLDFVENMAYTFLPGKAFKLVPKVTNPILNTLGKILNTGLGAGANPALMEGADALIYDENDNTDRSEFSSTDALIGTALNMAIPEIIKGPMSKAGQIFGGAKKGPKWASNISNLGEGKSISDLSREAEDIGAKKLASIRSQGGLKNQQNRIKQAEKAVKEAEASLEQANKKIPPNKLEIDKAKGNLELQKNNLDDIKKTTSEFIPALQAYDDKIGYNEYDPRLLDYVTELEKLGKVYKNYSWIKKPFVGSYANKAKLVDNALQTFDLDLIRKNEVRKELLDILRDVKFDSDRDAEKYLLSYIANKYADIVYKDRESNLPYIGDFLKDLKEDELIEKRNEARKENVSRFLLPDTTKEAK